MVKQRAERKQKNNIFAITIMYNLKLTYILFLASIQQSLIANCVLSLSQYYNLKLNPDIIFRTTGKILTPSCNNGKEVIFQKSYLVHFQLIFPLISYVYQNNYLSLSVVVLFVLEIM